MGSESEELTETEHERLSEHERDSDDEREASSSVPTDVEPETEINASLPDILDPVEHEILELKDEQDSLLEAEISESENDWLLTSTSTRLPAYLLSNS